MVRTMLGAESALWLPLLAAIAPSASAIAIRWLSRLRMKWQPAAEFPASA